MAEEAFALSPISARAALPSEEDYAAISAAFMETSRGRWFLGEYAKRNRNADTRMVLDAVARIEDSLSAQRQAAQAAIRDEQLAQALDALEQAADYIARTHGDEPADSAAASVPYLMLAGFTAGGALMARAAVKAKQALDSGAEDSAFYQSKIVSARFYADHLLPRAGASLPAVLAGGRWTNALSLEQFQHQS